MICDSAYYLLHNTYTKHRYQPSIWFGSLRVKSLWPSAKWGSLLHRNLTITKLNHDGVIDSLQTDHLRHWRNVVTRTIHLRTGPEFPVKLHNDLSLGRS